MQVVFKRKNALAVFLVGMVMCLGLFSGFIFAETAGDMRRHTIYFLFVDRFFDGDSENNQSPWQPQPEDSEAETAVIKMNRYQGGDIKGLIQKLDYLKDLGIGAIWVTPLVDNVDLQGASGNQAYHGYWGKDFFEVDEHFGSWQDFNQLIAQLRTPEVNIQLILDFAPNHSNPNDEMENGVLYREKQRLFNYLEDATAEKRWYNHNGGVTDWNNAYQVKNHNLFNLSDFNQNAEPTYQYLKESAQKWIKAGVDGIRIDAIKHMDKEFIQKWTQDLYRYAKSLGRSDFFFFGEWFGASALAQGLDGTSIDYANTSGSALLDFGLRDILERVLCNRFGYSMGSINQYLLARDRNFSEPDKQILFLDNHDMARFFTVLQSAQQTFGPGNNEPGGGLSRDMAIARLKIGLAVIMTAKGIPCIYYGTEQYACNFTKNPFKQIGSDPFNREMMPAFDKNTDLFKLIKTLAELRQNSPAIQRGSYFERWVNEDVLIFERKCGRDVVLVALNRGAQRPVDVINMGLSDGIYTNLLGTESITIANGKGTIPLSAQGIVVLWEK
jgi:cyclomaltodextrin glucanotransferase